ncbi:hypothetical protein N1027_17950 [Herbiconiux sp. CPCC 205763]|uniref:Protein kinase domain-containing protein n=1 Tax=Herbiconiux aconitum TaxID=2970913 RepID=A0ABT2GV29_9MICO|nr:hypothetical protein [Herbiconiux aconitum]MCS5720018.1 hypothetical protein [Herbiconiux aconitum]
MSERDGIEERAPKSAGGSAVVVVRESDLGLRTQIGSGAATDVERLDAFTVAGHQGGLAFVRIRDRDAKHWHPVTLRRLIAWRNGLDASERATLDGVAAWPLALVADDGGAFVGCLVPLAAHPFYYVPSDDKRADKAPQDAKWLVSAPKRARRAGAVAPGERDLVPRSTVLARVSLLLELLHRHGIVYGDLSERSVLFGVGDVAEAFVIGAEGAVFGDDGALQRNSAGWAAPETFEDIGDDGTTDVSMSRAPSVQTVATDRYKLGLLILRVLAPAGDGLERSRDADRIRSVLDETGQRMMRDALGDDPEGRPSASEWYQYLRTVIVENLAAPVILRVDVSPALVAEGDEVRLEVELSGAQQLTIEMPGRADIRREVGGRVVFERFTARQSGRIGVRATNAHGEVAALSNVVRVLPVPAPAQIAVASPVVPASLGVLPDLAALEAALGISTPPSSGDAGERSPLDRVAELRARLDADAVPLHEVIRIGVEAERASRDRLFPSFEEFLGDIGSEKKRR